MALLAVTLGCSPSVEDSCARLCRAMSQCGGVDGVDFATCRDSCLSDDESSGCATEFHDLFADVNGPHCDDSYRAASVCFHPRSRACLRDCVSVATCLGLSVNDCAQDCYRSSEPGLRRACISGCSDVSCAIECQNGPVPSFCDEEAIAAWNCRADAYDMCQLNDGLVIVECASFFDAFESCASEL